MVIFNEAEISLNQLEESRPTVRADREKFSLKERLPVALSLKVFC